MPVLSEACIRCKILFINLEKTTEASQLFDKTADTLLRTVSSETNLYDGQLLVLKSEELSKAESLVDIDECILLNNGTIHDELLAILFKCIRKRGVLTLATHADSGIYPNVESLFDQLYFAGFFRVEEVKDYLPGFTAVRCRRPSLDVGEGVAIKTTVSTKEQAGKVWLLNAGDVDDDLIDENELVKQEDYEIVRPQARACGVEKQQAKKKPCKNCTCGLADKIDLTGSESVKSSCGSCHLGDAFRCSTCPYRGLPPFKPGEKVKLPESDDNNRLPASGGFRVRKLPRYRLLRASIPFELRWSKIYSSSTVVDSNGLQLLTEVKTSVDRRNLDSDKDCSLVLHFSTMTNGLRIQTNTCPGNLPKVPTVHWGSKIR
uniref:Anamorsin homolog n=1 Tax=Trichuris muris TaxID=70415 RepID=A0A5S6QAN0_TRIMR